MSDKVRDFVIAVSLIASKEDAITSFVMYKNYNKRMIKIIFEMNDYAVSHEISWREIDESCLTAVALAKFTCVIRAHYLEEQKEKANDCFKR